METKRGTVSRFHAERPRGRGRRLFWAVLALVVLVAGWKVAHGHGAGAAGGMLQRHEHSPAEIGQHVMRGLDHLADRVEATVEQRQRLSEVAAGLAEKLRELEEQRV